MTETGLFLDGRMGDTGLVAGDVGRGGLGLGGDICDKVKSLLLLV